MLASPHGCSQRLFQAPAQMQTALQCLVAGIEIACPVRDALGLAVKSQYHVCSHVARLLSLRCPSAVVGFVVSVVVDAFNRVFRARSWPHIVNKISYRVSPAIAHSNTTGAVPMIASVPANVAPFDHSVPYMVRWVAGESMNGLSAYTALRAVASTQVARCNNTIASALTPTQPLSVVPALSGILKNGPATEDLSSDVFDAGRNDDRIRVSHVTVPQLLDVVRMAVQLQLCGYSRLYPQSA